MSTVKETIKHLQSWRKPDDHVAVVIWCDEDVIGRAKENGIKLIGSEVDDALDEMGRHHDCEVGITWDTIDFWIDEIVSRREKKVEVTSGKFE